MATSRLRQHHANPRSSHADSDSGGDTEREHTPRPPPGRTLSKKRLSEHFDPDPSFSLDDTNPAPSKTRHPLKTVSINDDVAEKRRRRKSAKITLPLDPDQDPEPGPSNVPHTNEAQDAPSEGSRTSNLPRQKSQLLAVPQAPEINVPLDVMTSNFDQWMKMATDNKINAANSWNFALIDYFHDMSLLRNNTDNSINFQRASCTLDGCVKIWTSRVDSVGTETGKLLSNLANGGRGDDGGDASDNPDGADPSQSQRKRKTYRSESTLVKNPAQLRTKKLDLEFTVDPLFRKTCADFDEGGAQGLLMNHLGLTVTPDGGLRVVFDASDSVAKGEEEEQPLEEPHGEVDLSYLREQFIPDLSIIDEHEISHSLEGFAFGKDGFSVDDTTFFQDGGHPLDDDDHDGIGDLGDPSQFGNAMDVDGISGSAAPVEDFFAGDQAIPDDYADFGAGYGGDADNVSVVGSDGTPAEHRQGPFVPFDPRRVPNDREIVMAVSEDGQGVANYFDPAFFKNWAGPEHWKLRKAVRRPDASEAAASRPKREKKEAFRINFLTPDEEDIRTRKKTLFAPVVRGAGINLPGPSAIKKGRGRRGRNKEKDEKRNDQTLPDDMHFSDRQLVTLFLKPKFSLKMRGQRHREDGDIEGGGNGSFWAQAGHAAGPNDPAADESAMPFDTQFFHDDDDDGPGFDDVYDGGDSGLPIEAGEQDLLAATQGQTRRVKPEAVNYTKRAKRVDVRRLKDNIWKGLDIVAPHIEEGEDAMDTDERPPTDPAEARSFTSVISDLHKTYTKEKMDEISTSFCFICLLHLANERGLKLEVDGNVEEEEDSPSTGDNKVGNLWDLKVYRDPAATPAS
ncbi:barren [Ganoderma leucocontextum]|nr:barren [Ganoderma leucocontextum]